MSHPSPSDKLTISNLRLAISNDDIEHFKSIFENNPEKKILNFCEKVDVYFLLFLPKSKHTDFDAREKMLQYIDATPYVKPLYDRFSLINSNVNFIFSLANKDQKYLNFIHSYFNSEHFSYLIKDNENPHNLEDFFSYFNFALLDKNFNSQQLAQSFLHSKFRKELLFYNLGEEKSLIITLLQNGHLDLVKDCFKENHLFPLIKKKAHLMRYANDIHTFDYLVGLLGRDAIYEQRLNYRNKEHIPIVEKILTTYPPLNQKEKELVLGLVPDILYFENEAFFKLLIDYSNQTNESIFNQPFKRHQEDKENTLFHYLYSLRKNTSLIYLFKNYDIEKITTPNEVMTLFQQGFDTKVFSSVNKKLISYLIKNKKINDECYTYSMYKNLRLIDYMTLRNEETYVHYLISKKSVNLDFNSSNEKPEYYNAAYGKIFEQARMDREYNKLNTSIKEVEQVKKKIKI
jgi:hypothetical protein